MNLRNYNIAMTNATHTTMDKCYNRNGERKKQDTKANDSVIHFTRSSKKENL